jgi:hypothetical protein
MYRAVDISSVIISEPVGLRVCGGSVVQNTALSDEQEDDLLDAATTASLAPSETVSSDISDTFVWDLSTPLELRKLLDSSSDLTANSVLTRLRGIRNDAKRILEEAAVSSVQARNLKDDILTLCSSILTVCRSAPIKLPPLYENSSLKITLDSIIHSLNLREIGNIDNDNHGHYVLCGVQGTGKTTILLCIALLSSVLYSKVCPVAWNYSKCEDGEHITRPVDILKNFAVSYLDASNLDGSSIMDTCRWLRRQDCLPLLLLDEIQILYTRDSKRTLRISAAFDIYSFSRQYGTFCVMTGSAYNMRHYLFRNYCTPDEWIDFPNFNASLFCFACVPALRSATEISNFIRVRYPLWSISHDDAGTVLQHTGGIGRHVDDFYKTIVLGRLNGAEHFRPNRRRHLLELLTNSMPFGLFVSKVMDDNNTNVNRGVPYGLIAPELQSLGYIVDQCISEWVDCGCAYGVTGEDDSVVSVELAVPNDIVELENNPKLTVEFKQLRMFYLCIAHILFGDGNAVKTLETLIRPRILTLTEDWQDSCKIVYCKQKLSITQAMIFLDDARATVKGLNDRLFEWEGETGLDGVWFSFSNEDEVTICGWRCKCGHHSVRIAGGKLGISRKNVDVSNNYCVSGVDDQTIHGIIVKAEIGFLKIATALVATFPQLKSIKFGDLLITTTTNGDAAHAYLAKDGREHELSSQWFRLVKVKDRKLKVHFYDGVAWMEKCLPRNLIKLLPPAWSSMLSVLDKFGVHNQTSASKNYWKVGCAMM